MSRNGGFERITNILKPNYEFIVIDSAKSESVDSEYAYRGRQRAHSCTVNIMRFRDLLNFSKPSVLVQKNLNDRLKVEGALMTMYDARLSLSKQVVDEVRNCIFREKVFQDDDSGNVKPAKLLRMESLSFFMM